MGVGLESVKKSFGEQLVLNNVSCEFPDREISTVLGISGCGKTTLLRIIAGLEEPDEGDVFMNHERVTNKTPQQRNLGMVFQDLASYPHLQVGTNLLLPLLAKGFKRDAAISRVKAIAQRFGIGSFLDRRATLLSGGELQRLALGRAMIREPNVMLLDEPFSQLDAPLQREARQFVFSELRSAGTTTVLVTHNHQDAQEAGGTVFFLDEGSISQRGSWEDLYWCPATPRVAQVVSFLEPVALPGEVVAVGNSLRFQNSAIPLDLPIDNRLASTWNEGNCRAKLFFRPEVLTVKQDEASLRSGSTLDGEVMSLFLQGSTRFCRFANPSGIIIEARNEHFQPAHGSKVSVMLEGAPQLLLWPERIKRTEPGVGDTSYRAIG